MEVAGKRIMKLIKLETSFNPRAVSLHIKQPLDRGWLKVLLIYGKIFFF